ncbi:MAG: NAD(P)-dependent alcohol dehydrogenase [Acidimicrobiales bacterium]
MNEATPARAIVQRRYGDTDTCSVGEVDRPTIGDSDVLVEVRAAAIDRGTWHLMTGTPYLARLAFGVRSPRTPVPGLDLAGVVLETGSAVTRFAPGDEVFGIGRGSLATLSAAPEDKLAHKPAALSFAQAAATGVSGLTALQALCDVGRLTAGQHVLIIGASGGVGTFAVQIAAACGARVTGVCSTAKVDLVTSLGADEIVDHTRDDVADTDDRYDLIVDAVGTTPLRRLRRILTPRGTLVVVGNAEGGRWFGGLDRQARALAWSPFVRQRLTALVSKEHHHDLERLAALASDGRLVPCVERTYPLAEAPVAMRHLAAGRARGKLVIEPARAF